ncbi:MAG TPA: hypothetical protein VET89_14655 [Stellaceae bacterium]|nr:hypothetical protein [Stellaceae bacterium]
MTLVEALQIDQNPGHGLSQQRVGDRDAAQRQRIQPIAPRTDNRRQHKEKREPAKVTEEGFGNYPRRGMERRRRRGGLSHVWQPAPPFLTAD